MRFTKKCTDVSELIVTAYHCCFQQVIGIASLPVALIFMASASEPTAVKRKEEHLPGWSKRLKLSASQPNSTSFHSAHNPGPGNDAPEPTSSPSTDPQAQVSGGKATEKEGPMVMFESTSHQGSSFNNISNMEIYDSAFTIENQAVSSFPNL